MPGQEPKSTETASPLAGASAPSEEEQLPQAPSQEAAQDVNTQSSPPVSGTFSAALSTAFDTVWRTAAGSKIQKEPREETSAKDGVAQQQDDQGVSQGTSPEEEELRRLEQRVRDADVMLETTRKELRDYERTLTGIRLSDPKSGGAQTQEGMTIAEARANVDKLNTAITQMEQKRAEFDRELQQHIALRDAARNQQTQQPGGADGGVTEPVIPGSAPGSGDDAAAEQRAREDSLRSKDTVRLQTLSTRLEASLARLPRRGYGAIAREKYDGLSRLAVCLIVVTAPVSIPILGPIFLASVWRQKKEEDRDRASIERDLERCTRKLAGEEVPDLNVDATKAKARASSKTSWWRSTFATLAKKPSVTFSETSFPVAIDPMGLAVAEVELDDDEILAVWRAAMRAKAGYENTPERNAIHSLRLLFGVCGYKRHKIDAVRQRIPEIRDLCTTDDLLLEHGKIPSAVDFAQNPVSRAAHNGPHGFIQSVFGTDERGVKGGFVPAEVAMVFAGIDSRLGMDAARTVQRFRARSRGRGTHT
jgi:hypothetical protein